MRFGLFEICFPVFWPLLPQSVRSGVTNKLERIRFRSSVKIPQSDVEIFVRDSSSKKIFPNSVDLISSAADITQADFSIVTTCKGESNAVVEFLDSLEQQSIKPREVIICDAGDNRGIEDEVLRKQESHQIKIIYFRREGLNIARARNEGVEKATSKIILFADFGTHLNENWALNLYSPFLVSDIDACMGWYESHASSELEKNFKEFLLQKIENINLKEFIPSARSLGVKKEVFKQLNGFPETLSLTAEDSLFGYQMKKNNLKLGFSPDAIATWSLPRSSLEYWKKVYKYSVGDAETGFLFWNHYYILVAEILKGVFDFGFLIVISIILNFFSVNILGVAFLLSLILTLGRTYSYLKGFGKLSNPVRTYVLFLHSSAQALGFVRGLVHLSKNKVLIDLINK